MKVALINLQEQELDIPLYEELETNNSAVNSFDRIQLGLDVENDKIVHDEATAEDETIYIDVPVYVRG